MTQTLSVPSAKINVMSSLILKLNWSRLFIVFVQYMSYFVLLHSKFKICQCLCNFGKDNFLFMFWILHTLGWQEIKILANFHTSSSKALMNGHNCQIHFNEEEKRRPRLNPMLATPKPRNEKSETHLAKPKSKIKD